MIAHVLRALCLSLLLLPLASLRAASAYDLNDAQDARFRKYLPRTYAKLLKRDPVHVVCVGDSVMLMYGHTPEYFNQLRAYQAIFLQEIANQFYYPAGVRVIRPTGGHPEKEAPIIGAEITLQNLARGGKLMIHAAPYLTASGFENKPDLVMISFGINDSTARADLAVYRKALQEVIALCKAQGADVLLFGPSLTVNDPPEQGLASTRPYADAMKEVAEANGVFFADLGDLSWLMTLDDRNKMLEKAKRDKEAKEKEKAKAEAAKAKGEGTEGATEAPAEVPVEAPPAPPSPVQNPIADEVDSDPEKKAARLFDYVVQSYRARFDHGPITDWVHPDANFQRVLGKRIFTELMKGPKELPWKVSVGTATFSKPDECMLNYEVENTTKEPLTLAILPLVATSWRPLVSPTEVTVQPGKKESLSITYVRTSTPTLAFQADEPFLRLPILHSAENQVRIEDVKATITPVAAIWSPGTSFNLEGKYEAPVRLVNTTDKPIAAHWTAGWMGASWNGTAHLPPNGEATVKVTLPYPKEAHETRLNNNLTFSVKAGDATLNFDRQVEMFRNLGLKETTRLVQVNAAVAHPTGVVSFRADADEKVFYLTWDIVGINLQESPDGSGALFADVSLDARSYGKRLMPGGTETVRVSTGSADGDGRVAPIPPWAFGTGYAMGYDATKVQGKLSSRPDGSRRFTLTLPKSYLYLHEWKIGNGNSQLGINAIITLWQPDDGSGQPGNIAYTLTGSTFHRDDAQSLAVLELSDKPTPRWTVRLH